MNEFLNSPEYIKLIEDNKDAIKKGEYKNKCLPISFSSSRDLRLTLGHASLYNLQYKNGVMTGTFWDGYNYEKKRYDLLKELSTTENFNDYVNAGKKSY